MPMIVCPLRRVVEGVTTSEPVPVCKSPLLVSCWQSFVAPPVPWACTVNDVVPAGVELVVLIVSVDVSVPAAVAARELGLNEAVAPVGSAVVTLRPTVQLLLPFEFPANAT